MYEIVLLDIDDTIFDYKKAEKYAMDKTFKELDFYLNNNEDDYIKFKNEYKIINSKLWEDLEKGIIDIEKLKTERFRKTFEKLNFKYDANKFSEYYIKFLGEGTYLFSGAEKLLKYLSEKYKIIIVTNGIKEVQIPRIKNSVIAKYIDEVVISGEVGASKPNSLIFEKAIEKLGYKCDKKNIIMIGDSQSADIQGAINYGVDSIWVNLLGREENKDIKATYNIVDYKEIYNIL